MFSRLHRRRSNLQDLGRLSKSCPAVDSPADSNSDSSFESVSTASTGGKKDAESSEDASPPVSPAEQRLARQSVRRARQREVQHQRNMEENKISMDDFLGKQAQFRTWLLEEQKKQDKDLSSPKRKTYFKMFVRLWNKRHLPAKYFEKRTSKHVDDLPENLDDTPSPLCARPPLFKLMQDSPLLDPSIFPHCVDLSSDSVSATPSPFSTFGKSAPSGSITPTFSIGRGVKRTPVGRKRSMSVSEDKENATKFSFPVTAAAAGPVRTASISPHKKVASVSGRPTPPLTLAWTRSSRSDLKVTPVDSPRCPDSLTLDQPEQDLAFPAPTHIYSEAGDVFSPQYAELQFADDSAIQHTPTIKSPSKSSGGRLNRRRSRSLDEIPTYAVPVKSARERRREEAQAVSEEEEDASTSPPPLPPKLFNLHEEGLGLHATIPQHQNSEDCTRLQHSLAFDHHSDTHTKDHSGKPHESSSRELTGAACAETSAATASRKPSKKLFKGRLPWLRKQSARRRSRSCEELSPRVPAPAKAAPQEEKQKENTSEDFPLLKLDGSPTLGRRAILRSGRQKTCSGTEKNNGGTNSKPQSSSTPRHVISGNDQPQFLPAGISRIRQSIRRRSRSLEQIASPSAIKQSPWHQDPGISYFRWPSPCENREENHAAQRTSRAKTHQHPSMLRSDLAASPQLSTQSSNTALRELHNRSKFQSETSDREETPMEVEQLDTSPKRLGQANFHRRQVKTAAADVSAAQKHEQGQLHSTGGPPKKQVSVQNVSVSPATWPPAALESAVTSERQLTTYSAQHGPARVQTQHFQDSSSSTPGVPSTQPVPVRAGGVPSPSHPPVVAQTSHQVQQTSQVLPKTRGPHQVSTDVLTNSVSSVQDPAITSLCPMQNALGKDTREPLRAKPQHETVSNIGTPVRIEELSCSPRQLGRPKVLPVVEPKSPAAGATLPLEETSKSDKTEQLSVVQQISSKSVLLPEREDRPLHLASGCSREVYANSTFENTLTSATHNDKMSNIPSPFTDSAVHSTSGHTEALCSTAMREKDLLAGSANRSESIHQAPTIHDKSSLVPPDAAAGRPLPAIPVTGKCLTTAASATSVQTPSDTPCATAVPERLRPGSTSRPQRRRSRSVDGASSAFVKQSSPSLPSPNHSRPFPEQQGEILKKEPALAGEVVNSVSQSRATLWQPHHNTWMAAKDDMFRKQASGEPFQVIMAQRSRKTVTEDEVHPPTPTAANNSPAAQSGASQACNTLARQLSVRISRQNSRRRSRSVGDVSALDDNSSSGSTTHVEDGASFSSLKAFWDRQRAEASPKVQRNFSINRRPWEQPRDESSLASVPSQHSPKTSACLQTQQHVAESSDLGVNSPGQPHPGLKDAQQVPSSPGGEDQLPIKLSPFVTVRRNSSLRSRNGRGGSPCCASQEPNLAALSEGSTCAQNPLSSSTVQDTAVFISKNTSSHLDAAKEHERNEEDLKGHTTLTPAEEEKQAKSLANSLVSHPDGTQKTASDGAKQKQRPVPPPKPSKRHVAGLQESLIRENVKWGIASHDNNTGKEGGGSQAYIGAQAECQTIVKQEIKRTVPVKRRSSDRQHTPSQTPAKRRSSGRFNPSTPQSCRRGSGVTRVVSSSVKRQSSGKTAPKKSSSRREAEITPAGKDQSSCSAEPGQSTVVARQPSVRQIAKAFSSVRRNSSGRKGTSSAPVTRQNSIRGASTNSSPVTRHGSDREVRTNAVSLARQGSFGQDSSPASDRKQIAQRQTASKAAVRRQSSGRKTASNSPQVTRQNRDREGASRAASIRKQISACEESKSVSLVRRFNSAREESNRSPYVTRNNSARETGRRSRYGKRRSDEDSGSGEARRSHSRGDCVGTGKIRRTGSSRKEKSVDSHSESDVTPSRGGSFRKKVKPPQSPTFMRITRNLHALDDDANDDPSDEDEPAGNGDSIEYGHGNACHQSGPEEEDTKRLKTGVQMKRDQVGKAGQCSSDMRKKVAHAGTKEDLETDIDTCVDETGLSLETGSFNHKQTRGAVTMV